MNRHAAGLAALFASSAVREYSRRLKGTSGVCCDKDKHDRHTKKLTLRFQPTPDIPRSLPGREVLLDAGVSHQISSRVVLHISNIFQNAFNGFAVRISAVAVEFAFARLADDICCNLALSLLLISGDAIVFR